jgi:hypothetical protein
MRYCREVERVMHTLHRLSAAALGLAPDFFDTPAGSAPTTLLVVSSYPPLNEDQLSKEQLRAVGEGRARYRAHSDYTGFTILLQDDADHGGPAGATTAEREGSGGLEIDVGGCWVPVCPHCHQQLRTQTRTPTRSTHSPSLFSSLHALHVESPGNVPRRGAGTAATGGAGGECGRLSSLGTLAVEGI